MWNITSNSIERAREDLQLRRTEIETRYAEEKQALDAECGVIDAVERACAEFMARHAPKDGVSLDEPSGGSDDSVAMGPEPPDPTDAAAADESPEAATDWPAAEDATGETGTAAGGLDILKPGSRWRLYRGGGKPSETEARTEDHLPGG